MKNLFALSVLLLVLILAACQKDSSADEPDTPGTTTGDTTKIVPLFTADINGTKSSAYQYEATYFVKRHELILKASFAKYYLTLGISINPASPLKKYLLESNGDNVAELQGAMDQYNTDHNLADAGGSFSLSAFDTLQGTLNGNLQFTSYLADRSTKIVFSADSLKNIPLQISTMDYDSSFASCTVNGVKTTYWQSKNFFAKVTCLTITDTGNIKKSLEVHVESVVGGYPNHRFILFRIPLDNPVGTYTIYPDSKPYLYCGRKNITSAYYINNIGLPYQATEGKIVITQNDKVHRKLKADFNISYKSLAYTEETIHISDGHIELNSWDE